VTELQHDSLVSFLSGLQNIQTDACDLLLHDYAADWAYYWEHGGHEPIAHSYGVDSVTAAGIRSAIQHIYGVA